MSSTHSRAAEIRQATMAGSCGFILLVLTFSNACPLLDAASDNQATSPRRASAPAYLNTAPGVEYVGSRACGRCHSEIYRTYTETWMGRSMAPASDAFASAMPPSPVTVHVVKFHRDLSIFRKGGNLYQSEDEPSPQGASAFTDTRRIAYVIGAGENGASYLVEDRNYLFEAPLSYYTRSHSFDLSPGYEFGDFGFSRLAPIECIVCHSGRPNPVPGRPGLYRDPPFAELAVGCENCHGPGQLHVSERSRGVPVEGAADLTIVNPARLPGWLADNICMMCHQAGDARVLELGKTYADFRPGTPLDETVAIFAVPFTPQSPPRDPLLQQYTQMILSKCYRASGGKLSCITCHDPHVVPSDAGAPAYYRRKCLACHSEKSCTAPRAARLSRSDDCAGCHMPRQSLEKISHSALTNHRIVARSNEPFPDAAFHMTTPSLPDLVHADAIPGKEGVTDGVMFAAYGELMSQHPEYRGRYLALLPEVAKMEPRDPTVLSALGRVAILTPGGGGRAEGLKFLSEAIAQGSTIASDYELYATLLAEAGETPEAISILERGISLDPFATRLYKRLALDYIQLHNYGRALETMKEELAVFPEDDFMRGLVANIEASAGATAQ